jgi:hypothetical protein
MRPEQVNWTKDPRDAHGWYESFYQRANHPVKSWAFWLRYTIFEYVKLIPRNVINWTIVTIDHADVKLNQVGVRYQNRVLIKLGRRCRLWCRL